MNHHVPPERGEGPLDIVGFLQLEPTSVNQARISSFRHFSLREAQLRLACQRCGIAVWLDHLPAASISRIAEAPVFSELLSSGDTASDAARELLLGWIDAESCLLGERPSGHLEWTALGDYRFAPSGRLAYAAPRLHGLVLDSGSPCVLAPPLLPPEKRVRTEPLTDFGPARAKLGEALAIIDLAAPAGVEMILGTLRVIHLYAENRSGFSSGSPRRYPGITSLGNAHKPTISAHQVADALLHEATHSVLYLAEVDTPFFRTAEIETPRVNSPWTGASLAMHSFAHACCVWYELANFWARMLETGDRHPETVRLLRRSATGFLKQDYEDALMLIADGITPFCRDLLESLAADVRSQWGRAV
ncbi:aKG-HExxH-type peptide beta-hydroxylase [Rhizobium leguminosarum]|uniref:aKG-HExxH-type peptide beta-hydroxylase n=1 Tax=Rhizobium leguminosarum TaxID=384 RepID=UPI00103DCDC0|nr:HEXXH motif-containing putative peptide modification protein [Rhizobium leguminosarum]MBY5494505.1 hypothetical protein [Rhizobium leguminosarum]MBY5530247.1 hypothetical protein [Rhizobium leguminosarum]NKK46199.1 hypothetical protein [Rhizobium leguminosarum bv. viciae]TBY30716.1 hypothetical protein E0H55_20775 [Rhizobium leguminosarum bv. viciae]TBY31590.1 hypothetical protein E0H60_29880 [Rhizobium leguminosarum bv. viciae]